MKLSLLVSLCAAAGFSLAATAAQAVDGVRLGQMEAVVAHCSQVKPADSVRYRELLTPLTSDVSVEELAAVRKSREYQRGYESITGQLAAAKKEEVIEACAGALESNI
ncbi:hypothetical protein SAMN04515618_115133 [Collimonas sp. OK307]|uniref:hypothetical protein n=1 Tax=Collimonas sp. OK307 TaxID=1801620 RepID=UPI0008EF7994|nr:hypothetical protein [Collimonas sp. OK307]SFI27356.1 hypothetical protein SAMN04515618_115133 [Collimonas sp. OK307]